MILLQAQNLTKRFEGQNLFTNVSLRIQDHSRIGLIGRNGVGKSTLIKILLGQEDKNGGKIFVQNHLKIGYLAQNTGLHSNRTIYQEMAQIFKGLIEQTQQLKRLEVKMGSPEVFNNPTKLHNITKIYDQAQARFTRENGYAYRAKIRGVLHGLGFTAKDYHRSINNLSGGQQSQLALAKLLLEKKDLLILDEPTNHIDVKTLTWLENYLHNYAGALLVISHDRYFLNKVVTEVDHLTNGSLYHYYGNYTDFTKQREKRNWLRMRSYQRQQAQIHREKIFIQKNIARASTAKRAKSRRKQLDKIQRIQRPINQTKVPRFRFHTKRASGSAVLDVHDLAIGYHQKVIVDSVNFNVKRNQAIAIIGPNGIGKSTLFKTIIGQIPKIKGTIQFGTGVSIGYYDQKQATLHPKKTILHELWDEHPNTDEGIIRSVLGSFLFSGEEVDKTVSELSGGEKARLQLTKLSMQKSNFLLLDEPTNHLDIASREVLEDALKHFQGTILFISHDRYFINQIATETVELSKHHTKIYLGNYDYYLVKKDEERAAKAERLKKEAPDIQTSHHQISQSKVQARHLYQKNKKQKRHKQRLERTIKKLGQELLRLDQEKQHFELQMAHYSQNFQKLTTLQKKLQILKQKKSSLEKIWLNKASQLDQKHN